MIDKINHICMWLSDVIILISLISLILFGIKHFFKKGKAFYARLVTLAMACYAMGTLYHLCQTLTSDKVVEGFTSSYLGKMGFFLFLYTANYGQINSLLDDGNPRFKKSRYIAVSAPIVAGLLFIPCLVADMPVYTTFSFALVWVCAMLSVYYNLKHAVIDDCGFGFAKAIRPYNASAVVLTFIELIQLLFWVYYDIDGGFIYITITSILFSIMSIVTMINLKRGIEAWTI